jgi:alginate O-acetyltransferase complex protein AlgI
MEVTEIQTGDQRLELRLTVAEALTPRRRSVQQHIAEVAQFLALVAQFGLVVLLVQYWQLESQPLTRLMWLAFAGFVIHHLLPLRFRLPFFAMLSLLAVITGVGHLGPNVLMAWLSGRIPLNGFLYHLFPGLTLIGIGLGLIGICHLPIRFGARVGLVAVAGAGLAFLRAHSRWFPDVTEMWVILGSMFMFRLTIYLYDLKHRTAPFSPSRAISYFFLLPNVCFPLFPVVDYKTFCSTYYNEHWVPIYQNGLRWMVRGVVQLLLYRIVYQFAPLDVYKLSSALDVAGCMLGMYLLYLRVSGTFHLIVGLLHMFGFNLPETHHLYLLASSFTDFWRRINIYWKDFVMKLFFYPTHFALRRVGPLRAMSVATLATFLATWLLHSWQWFWIRGTPLFNWKDFSFWMILAVLVLVTAIYETTRGRKRSLTPSRVTLRQRFILGLEAGTVFCLMCILWTFWTCQSWAEFQTLIDAASKPTLRDIAIVLVVFAIVCVCGMLWGRSSRETSEGRSTSATPRPFHFWRSAVTVTAGSICLLAGPSIATWTIPATKGLVARVHNDVLNARDMNQQRRGYYEELDVGRMDNWRWHDAQEPEGWSKGKKAFFRPRSDFLLTDVVPSMSTVLGGAPCTSNSLGMRDREYQKAKPANTYRIVLLGASNDMGTGVNDDQTYENLVEDNLNSRVPDARYSRYEILNLSVAADSILQRVLRLEQEGLEFQPDAAILSVTAVDDQFIASHLRKALIRGIEPSQGYREVVQSVVRRAHVNGKMPAGMIERRLQPYTTELCGWSFQRFAQQCTQRGVRPLVMYRPAPADFSGLESSARSKMLGLARTAGLEVIDLSPAFDSVADRSSLFLAKWDDHTTTLGHRLLADKLYQGVVPLLFGSPSKQQTSRLQKP